MSRLTNSNWRGCSMKRNKADCFNLTRGEALQGRFPGARRKNAQKVLIATVWAICILAVSAYPLRAQAPGTGAITGTVTDPSGGVVRDAQISVVNEDTGLSRSLATAGD